MIVAAVTTLPFAYLYESGGRTFDLAPARGHRRSGRSPSTRPTRWSFFALRQRGRVGRAARGVPAGAAGGVDVREHRRSSWAFARTPPPRPASPRSVLGTPCRRKHDQARIEDRVGGRAAEREGKNGSGAPPTTSAGAQPPRAAGGVAAPPARSRGNRPSPRRSVGARRAAPSAPTAATRVRRPPRPRGRRTTRLPLRGEPEPPRAALAPGLSMRAPATTSTSRSTAARPTQCCDQPAGRETMSAKRPSFGLQHGGVPATGRRWSHARQPVRPVRDAKSTWSSASLRNPRVSGAGAAGRGSLARAPGRRAATRPADVRWGALSAQHPDLGGGGRRRTPTGSAQRRAAPPTASTARRPTARPTGAAAGARRRPPLIVGHTCVQATGTAR
jgi:hypothetical protein